MEQLAAFPEMGGARVVVKRARVVVRVEQGDVGALRTSKREFAVRAASQENGPSTAHLHSTDDAEAHVRCHLAAAGALSKLPTASSPQNALRVPDSTHITTMAKSALVVMGEVDEVI